MSFAVVYRKECRDNLRDRRSMISSMSLAVVGPVLFVGMMTFVLNTAVGERADPVPLTVVGADFAPDVLEHLRSNNVVLTPAASDDPRGLIESGEHDIVLVIPDDYAERFRSGRPMSLALIRDSAKFGASNRHFGRIRSLLQGYASMIGMLRLQVRGIDPVVVQPFTVLESDTASPAARALTILATLPYLLVLTVFMGGFYLAIDATAGEREHGSLEPLLLQPVSRSTLVLAKIAAAATFAMLAMAVFLSLFAMAVPMLPLHKIGMSLEITMPAALMILIIATPLALFAAALLTLMASFAKSYKEAQTYLTFVILVPTLPLIVSQLMNVEPSARLMLLPSLSQAMLIADLIVGRTIDVLHVVISAASTLAAGALLAWLAVRLYRRERILI